MVPSIPASLSTATPMLLPETEKASRAAELQARIQSKLAMVGLGGASGATPSGCLFTVVNYCYILFRIATNAECSWLYYGT